MRWSLRAAFERLDGVFERAFGPEGNPLVRLGALGWFFYWIVAGTGIYLYIFYDTGVSEAYASVEYLTHTQWYAGGIMRSLHRYASDALVVVVLLHLVREFTMDRLHGARSFGWITGVVLIGFLYASGITGYWIVWDRFAQYVAVATAEWLDALPLFGEPIARNFLHASTLSGRFFTLFVFIHIAVPLIMLFLMWLHIQRLSRPSVNPPRTLALGTLGVLLVLSLARPALSQGPADLAVVPAVVNMDWFYFTLYPLLDRYPGMLLWAALGAATILLIAGPWVVPRRFARLREARVNLDYCNGCGRCVADCPFSAITLGPRSDGLPYGEEAVVDASLCVSCGICAGACPTATPFRRRSALVPGIELPDFSIARLREEVLAAARKARQGVRVLVLGCDAGPDLEPLRSDDTGVLTMPCIGMLPPSFIDFILSRGHADGIVLSGCRQGDCHFRLGDRWTRLRLARQRDPALRARVPRDRIAFAFAGPAAPRRAIASLRASLEAQGLMHEQAN